ncbi:MAG: WcaI family glycosyltransferase [Candidatus Parcubacteria bacterium]|nr:WcaI family glycosyltransferase [Burkholderiales bacterium]
MASKPDSSRTLNYIFDWLNRARNQRAQSGDPAAEKAPALRVAIVGINYAPELTGIGVYSTGFAEFLAARGFEVDVYTAFPYYPAWRKEDDARGRLYRSERLRGVNVRRHYLYVPRRPGALARMLHELSFILSASIGYLFGPTADCTIVVSPPLPLGIPISLLARLKLSRVIFHAQDLQPDAAIELGLLKKGRFCDMLLKIEGWTYALAHRVSSIGRAMLGRVQGKGVPGRKLLLMKNWANDDVVRPLERSTSYRARWSLGERFVVLYSGNLGVKQGLGMVLDCAARMRERDDVVFVIVGDGGEKAALVARAEAEGLGNIQFHPLQPLAQLGELLATADVAVIPQKPGFGDIVLPSKLANILASERPVVAAVPAGSELAVTLREAACGLVVEPGDAAALAGALRHLADDPRERSRLASNGRRYMLASLARDSVLAQHLRVVEALLLEENVVALETTARSPENFADARAGASGGLPG